MLPPVSRGSRRPERKGMDSFMSITFHNEAGAVYAAPLCGMTRMSMSSLYFFFSASVGKQFVKMSTYSDCSLTSVSMNVVSVSYSRELTVSFLP